MRTTWMVLGWMACAGGKAGVGDDTLADTSDTGATPPTTGTAFRPTLSPTAGPTATGDTAGSSPSGAATADTSQTGASGGDTTETAATTDTTDTAASAAATLPTVSPVDTAPTAPPPTCDPDAYESNDSYPQAAPLTWPAAGVIALPGLTHPPGDADFYRLPVGAGCAVAASIAFDHATKDLDLSLVETGTFIPLDQSWTLADSEMVSWVNGAAGAREVYVVVFTSEVACATYDLVASVACP